LYPFICIILHVIVDLYYLTCISSQQQQQQHTLIPYSVQANAVITIHRCRLYVQIILAYTAS